MSEKKKIKCLRLDSYKPELVGSLVVPLNDAQEVLNCLRRYRVGSKISGRIVSYTEKELNKFAEL